MKPDQTSDQSTDTYDQPVAYDAQGRPLYAHPPIPLAPTKLSQPAVEQVVHVVRSIDPIKQEVNDDMKK